MIEASQIRQKESKIFSKLDSPWLIHVLLYELLIGRNKTLRGKTVYEKSLLKHKTFLLAEWARLKVKKKAKCDAEMATCAASEGVAMSKDDGKGAQHALPRYVRVNTLKASVDDVIRDYEKRVC